MGKESKIEALKKELEETKKIMVKNFDLVIARGKKLEVLKDKSRDLKLGAQVFQKSAKDLKRELQWHNIMLTLSIIGATLGAVIALLSGYPPLIILAMSALGGVITGGIFWLGSGFQHKFNLYKPKNSDVSPKNKINVLFKTALRKILHKERTIMTKKSGPTGPGTPSTNDDDPDREKEMAEIAAELEKVKKLEADKAQLLIQRGQLLDKLTSGTTELKQNSETFQTAAHQVERVEEAKNHHLTSILIGMGGFALGVLYAFLSGYTWPLMLVFGALGGTLTYGVSSVLTGSWDKLVGVGDAIRTFSWFQSKATPYKEREVIAPSPQLEKEPDISKPKGILPGFKNLVTTAKEEVVKDLGLPEKRAKMVV